VQVLFFKTIQIFRHHSIIQSGIAEYSTHPKYLDEDGELNILDIITFYESN
jgi:hypothetical protein|tara:strand:- start:169 stop:321 length:153 start_codon:yes stop_codon:yes gene_type:complete